MSSISHNLTRIDDDILSEYMLDIIRINILKENSDISSDFRSKSEKVMYNDSENDGFRSYYLGLKRDDILDDIKRFILTNSKVDEPTTNAIKLIQFQKLALQLQLNDIASGTSVIKQVPTLRKDSESSIGTGYSEIERRLEDIMAKRESTNQNAQVSESKRSSCIGNGKE